jgi:cytochrome c556
MKLRHLILAVPAALVISNTVAAEKDLVKYRENVMNVIGGHMGAIVAIVKGEVPYSSELAFHADALAAAAPKALPAFKTEAMTEESEALPDIWKDWGEFEKHGKKLEETSAALAVAAKGDDMAAIGAALGDVGKSCKGCHDNFTEEH